MITLRGAARDQDGEVTQTGNQLRRQPPRADLPTAETTSRADPVRARTPSPQDTLRTLDTGVAPSRRPPPSTRTTARMRLTRRGIVVVITLGLALLIGM